MSTASHHVQICAQQKEKQNMLNTRSFSQPHLKYFVHIVIAIPLNL